MLTKRAAIAILVNHAVHDLDENRYPSMYTALMVAIDSMEKLEKIEKITKENMKEVKP